MNKDKMRKIRTDIDASIDEATRLELTRKLQYAFALNSKQTSIFRKREIARRVAEKYTLEDQIDIALSGDTSEIALLKAFKSTIATEVDKWILATERELM